MGFYATPFLRELLTTFTDFLGLFSIFILCIIICYTVNWVRLEGGQEQYFPQNPVVGPSRREGGGVSKSKIRMPGGLRTVSNQPLA